MRATIVSLRAAGMAGATALVCLALGCAPPKPDATELAKQIYKLGDDGKWADTMPLAKSMALAYPSDPAAHYLLGKAYLHRAEPHLVQAEGELMTALGLYDRAGASAPVAWASAHDFKLALHRDLALVSFRWIREAMRMNLYPQAIRDKLLQARDQVDAGLAIDPSDSFLTEMRATIEQYLAGPYKDLPPPAAAPAAA